MVSIYLQDVFADAASGSGSGLVVSGVRDVFGTGLALPEVEQVMAILADGAGLAGVLLEGQGHLVTRALGAYDLKETIKRSDEYWLN